MINKFISKDETFTSEGITYTAISEAQLNLDDEEKVSGLASGKISAVVTGAEKSPQVVFDATDEAINFTAESKGEIITVRTLLPIEFIAGEFTYTSNKLSISAGSDLAIVTQRDDYTLRNENHFEYDSSYIFNATSITSDSEHVINNFILSNGNETRQLQLEQFGKLINNFTKDGFTLVKGSSLVLNTGDYKLTATALNADAGLNFDLGANGLSFIPNTGDGTLNVAISRNGSEIFSGELECTKGSITFGYDKAITLAKDTSFNFIWDNYVSTITARDSATFAISLTDNGITFTPATDDGTLDVTLSNGSDTLSVNLEILSGSFTLGENGSLTVAKDTELKIDFGNNYIVDFKTTGDAGGKISLGKDGINFTPDNDEGHLKISVTKDGKTRTASLEMTGSLTYKLDGSINLAKGTVLKNIFEDGNELTITAKTDAGGSIIFNPTKGLTITPSTPDALEVVLSNNGFEVANFSSIDGTINYSSGVVTAEDGAKSHLSVYDTWETELCTTGGTSSIAFMSDRTVYTANAGATFVLDYLDGSTLEIQNGSFSDIYATETEDAIELISEGSNFKTNDDEFEFTLEKAGNYTLNGMQVTTTADNVQVQLSNYDTVTFDDISYTPLDENVKLTLGEDGSKVTGGKVSLTIDGMDKNFNFDTTNGSISYDSATKKFSFATGTILSMKSEKDTLQFIAKEDFSITAEKTAADKVSFKLDGSAELEIVNNTRKATLDFTGGIVYGSGGSLSLENGTEVNIAWEDGTKLQLTSHGSDGSILFDADKGVRITSDDENLSMKLTSSAGFSTDISAVKGSLWYNAGVVSFDENSKLTATTTLGGQPIFTTLETVGGTGHISFNTTNGVLYAADTGALKVTWSKDDLESTFIINSGSVQLGHNLFRITEGSDIATDLKNFVPAFYFTTAEAGNYTINGQTITTTVEGLALTATDDYMSFTTSDDVIKYDGMTFAGNGKVSLKPDIVALGDGVKATGFGEGNSFMLAEAGNVTVDAKIFEATSLKNKLDEEIPLNVSVAGEADGFTFSREMTRQSEDYFNKPNYSNIGKIFREEFHSTDDSYRIQTDPIGLEKIIGISDGATIKGSATFDGEPEETIFDVVTETEGSFTIDDKTFTISGDSSVAIMADFEPDKSYVRGFRELDGTVSGDFTAHVVSINGSSSAVQVFGDNLISIAANESGFEIFGLDTDASLQVAAKDSYIVNETTINANAKDYIVGTDEAAYLYAVNNDTLVSGTEKNDSIINTGSNVTIQPLKGDDYIYNHGANVVFVYSGGDDTINGFKEDSVLSLGSDYSTLVQGEDVLVNVGENKIILKGATTLDDLEIVGASGVTLENRTNDSLISGTNNNDSIANHGTNSTIQALGGNDTVLNEAASVSVDGGTGNDSIHNGSAAYQSTLLGNLGNDSISNYGVAASIDGDAGNDYIENYGDYSLIEGGDGNDTIHNESKHTTINGGSGNDSISNGDMSDNVSVNGGDGDDTIRNQHAYNVTLNGGPGNDKIIVVTGHHTTINGGDGNDTILGETLEGNSSWAMGGYSNIDGGDGDDYIDPIYSDSASINGGAGNDTIINEGYDATLNGGAGDDVISLHGASLEGTVIKYEEGEGNDLIFGFTETTKLSITSGTKYSTVVSGDDVIVNVGSNEITIAGGKNLSTINIINYDIPALNINNDKNNTSIVGSSLNDTITNSGSSVTIQGLAGNDSITSSGERSFVDGGSGADSIFNSGANSTLLGDYGNDYLSNSAENVSISGGYGNDTIENSGDNVTVTAGNGFNLTSNTGDNVLFNFGGGIDTIIGFKENSTLSVGSADFSTVEGIKNALVISGNSVTVLKDALLNDDSININGEAHELGKEIHLEADGDEASISRSNVSIYSGTGDDQISLTANAKNNTIIYNPEDGNDTIYGFNETTKLTISDRPFSAETSGNDLIVTVGESKITLINAASLSANVATVYDPLTLDVMALRKTEAGYPVMAEVAFHPNEYLGPEPTNYADKDDWTITSADNLKLHAVCYTPENSGDKWAVLIHGYGKDHKAMYTTATAYLDNGYNVLLIDQRAAGESEGEWLTMGAAEAQDVALWTQEIVSRNSNAKIALHGVSMGAATAILAAARSDAKNVTALIDDCGYTNVMAVFDLINAAMLKQADTVVAAMDPVAKVLTGYYLHDAAPIDSIPSAKMPSLFITGSADVVAPVSMLDKLYDASGAEVKEKYIAEGIEHGRAAFDDPANYSNAVFRFIAEANEEGWVTNNTVSSISLRGTSYDDSITNSGNSVTIDSGAGNDTITNTGSNVSIDAGAGNNLVSLSGTSEVIVFNGDTTVEGFKTGFGEGTDTVYITSNPAGVDFKDGVLAFYNDNASLTMSDLTTTAKVNIYHKRREVLNKGIFIAEDAWYKVEDSDLTINAGEEIYFVGPSATSKHGVDFSGISSDLNLTLDTAYIDSEDYVPGTSIWINGVYSIRGGAGLTTITGSNLDDTIIAGSGSTTINASGGDDVISLTGAAALINYTSGDGNDTIYGFNENTQISISGGYSSVRVGDDVIVSVGDNSITVVDASSVIAVDFEDGDSFRLTEKGAVTVDGKVFELTKDVPSGVTITGTKDGFLSEILDNDGTSFFELFVAQGDEAYTVQIGGKGIETISGIDAGTRITTSATKDGEEEENQIYIVTEDAGTYAFNDMTFTTSKDNTAIQLRPQAMAFDADGIVYNGKTFTGSGNVTVSTTAFALGSDVSASGFDKNEFILAQKGTTTVDGRVFELTENVPEGITVTPATDGYIFSHALTQAEVTAGSLSSDYVGKVFSEEFTVQGDDTYTLQANSLGLKRVSGISDGSTILGGDTSVDGGSDSKVTGQFFYVDTETEGAFTIGEKTYSISGDSNVEIGASFDSVGYGFAESFASLDGTVSGDFDGDEFYVNGKKDPILIKGDDSIKVVGSSSGTKLFDVSDKATLVGLGGVKEIHTDTEGVFNFVSEEDSLSVDVSIIGDNSVTFKLNSAEMITNIDDVEGDIIFSETSNEIPLLINGMGGIFDGKFSSMGAYDNSLYVHDVADGSSFTTKQADKIWLQMVGETMTLNGNRLTLTGDDDGIWLRDKEIVGLDEGASLKVSAAGTYTTRTAQINAKAGDVIVGLENDDAYIYNEDRPPITSETSDAELIEHFEPNNYTVASNAQNISLGGGDLAIIEKTSAHVSITAGDDTVVSRGENVHVSLTGGNTQMFPLEGKMTLDNYDSTTGAGFNFAGTNILAWLENGDINFNDGKLKFGSAQVDIGTSDELINFYNIVGKRQRVGWAAQSDSLDVSSETADLVLVAKKNSSVTSGSGNDTILSQGGNFIDGGKGSNLVSISSEGAGSHIVLDGRTTVEGFKTGFGEGTDTVYIKGDPAVDFKSGGLTFYEDKDSFTLRDVHETAKVNLYYSHIDWLRKGVFIADDDWYTVAEDDLAVSSDEGVYFVGATAKKNHGVDFSNVTQDLNVTLNTDYDDKDTSVWINNIHSIKGGAGLTTIIGSDKSDTILAGKGESSIWSGAGPDKMFGSTDEDKDAATFFYMAGDGRDSIENFDFMTNAQDFTADKIQLDDNSEITDVFLRGNDVGIRIDGVKDEHLLLTDAKGKSFRVNDDLIAKVDTDVEFDGFTNCYVGIGTKATLTVGKDSGNVEVWLSDDSLEYHGTMYDGDFKVLDASQSDGSNILAGNELNNSIIGGAGNDSLWGGYSSSDDTLIGGAGQNTFFYLQGNGRDVIKNVHNGDSIILDDITLDQITDANITAGGVMINFNDGGSLTIDGTADVTYQLADGSKYSANHERLEWEDK